MALLADQIVMKNGDRVTGSIVKKDEKTLTIKSTHFGTVTLPWSEVSSVTADKPVNVELTGGQTVQGTLEQVGDKVQVTSAGTKQTVAPADIVTLRDEAEQKAYLRMLNPGWGSLWTINANLNFAGTSGNARASTLTTPVTAVRSTRNDKTSAYFNFIKSSATVNRVNSATAEAARGGVSYSRNIHPRMFLTVFNDWEYDRFQSLDLRMVIGGGLGYIAWKSEKGRLDLVGGASYNREKFDPTLGTETLTRKSAELYWGDDFTYKMSARLSLVQSYRMFNNLSNTGELRQNGDLSLTTALTKWLTWNISLSDRYLSNPLPGRRKNDFLYSTGLGIVLKP